MKSTAKSTRPGKISPDVVGTFIAMTLAGTFAAKFVTSVLIDAPARGFYQGAKLVPGSGYYFITHFFSCAMGSLVFVWVGSRFQKELKRAICWLLAALATAVGFGLIADIGVQGLIGQSVGAVAGVLIFGRTPHRAKGDRSVEKGA